MPVHGLGAVATEIQVWERSSVWTACMHAIVWVQSSLSHRRPARGRRVPQRWRSQAPGHSAACSQSPATYDFRRHPSTRTIGVHTRAHIENVDPTAVRGIAQEAISCWPLSGPAAPRQCLLYRSMSHALPWSPQHHPRPWRGGPGSPESEAASRRREERRPVRGEVR